MKRRKAPLTPEEEKEICRKCGGFCCKYYFFNAEENPDALALHTFRQRNIITYGRYRSIILEDRCPYTSDEKQCCTELDDPDFPKLCREFPNLYRPFWNLRCKLMRVRYARGMIKKDVKAFQRIDPRKKSGFHYFRNGD